MLLSNDVLDKVGQNWVSLNTSTGKRCYFSGCCTARKVIISSFAGIGYCGSKTSNRFFRSSFYGQVWGWHRFPHEGNFRWILVGVYRRNVYCCPIFRGGWGDPRFEQLVLGWLGRTHGTAGKIPQYFDKATWGCIWGSQMNAGVRHDRKKRECCAQSEGCWVRSQGGLYIAMEPDRFTVVKGKNLPA